MTGGTAERRNGGRALPANALRFKRSLLKWFRGNGRALPWRETRDPYRIVVSEFMLQQTQVSRVLEYYPRFLRRFPTVQRLARARPRAVREAWEGLGYYRRAANLHRLARTVVREHAGTIPDDPATLESLPGIGKYTAGAVATFAYERRAAAVDTNVRRVLGRVFWRAERRNGLSAERRNGGTAERAIWELAERLLPRSRAVAWEFNQALMDLGARICVARTPRCTECPVRGACRTGTRRTS
jgi:A/G-specific adenine glycosylase